MNCWEFDNTPSKPSLRPEIKICGFVFSKSFECPISSYSENKDPLYSLCVLIIASNIIHVNHSAISFFEGSNLDSFDTNGFTVDHEAIINGNGANYVTWGWKANGGTTASNSSGTITSTVQADTTAGFSIVTYNGTGSAATVGHGLGVVPDAVIIKCTNDWKSKFKFNNVQ